MPVGRGLLGGRAVAGGGAEELAAGLRHSGMALIPDADDGGTTGDGPPCPVLGWASSGAMSLTGWPGQAPRWPGGDVVGRLTGATHLLSALARELGCGDLALDVGALLTERASWRQVGPNGSTSLGGHCRLLRTADSWVAVNLARPGDLELVPALTGGELTAGGTAGDRVRLWEGLRRFARHRLGHELTARAQLLGIPAGHLQAAGRGARPLPWTIERLGEPVQPGGRPLRVVDFSALWSGPLCAHLLGRCGAQVVKVEDIGRPDAARQGDPRMFERLHEGHDQLRVDFRSPADSRVLGRLIDSADIVIEASRPRALAALGYSPEQFLGRRPGRTWVSITGYGRTGPLSNWVAFGDDAAVSGGLVAWDGAQPVFCADAIADPVSGVCAATAALASSANGGGHLIDCSMQAAAAFVNGGGACDGEHRVERRGAVWFASHQDVWRPVEPPRPVATGRNAAG